MVTICLALTLVVCMLILLRQRRIDNRRPSFVVPGGSTTIVAALIGGAAMVGIAIVEPFFKGHATIPVEWVLLLAWGIAGLATWRVMSVFRDRAPVNR
jgi:hypothetical protein